ncbi:hypothetical protein AA098_21365 [Pseudomonas sp. JY-Q]|nr:hypothetical protein AA098_21365 [Pseudomonas sp. JY-Q]
MAGILVPCRVVVSKKILSSDFKLVSLIIQQLFCAMVTLQDHKVHGYHCHVAASSKFWWSVFRLSLKVGLKWSVYLQLCEGSSA